MKENFKVILSWDAREDIVEGIDKYEKIKNGLGFELDEEIDLRMKEVGKSPFLCQKIHGDIRAAHLKRFPYSIFYWIDDIEGKVNVVAVRPQAGNPKRWQRRIR